MLTLRPLARAACLARLLPLLMIFSKIQPAPGQEAASGPSAAASVAKQDDLEAAASDLYRQEEQQQQLLTSATGHEILATGWPATSPMWPSLQRDESADAAATPARPNEQFEPFIYADKPNELDYALLLSLNKSFIDSLRANLKLPVQVELSFEYYFNHDDKATGLPNIKIEIDRRETKYVIAAANRTRMWVRHSERLLLAELNKLERPDWLKVSLVNREAPSLVAIRRLKVLFANEPASTEAPAPAPGQAQPETPPPTRASPSGSKQPDAPPSQESPGVPEEGGAGAGTGEERPGSADTGAGEEAPDSSVPFPGDQQTESSNAIASTIKPVRPKPRGWSSLLGARRRKRQAPAGEGQEKAPSSYLLTCFNSDACEHWKADGSNGLIRWSLARQPPSTEVVRAGYHYASNRQSYGDASKLLLLTLNQTESATIVDQNSDHCLELAIYVTERARLKLYRLVERSSPLASQLASVSSTAAAPAVGAHDERWVRSNLVLSWAPTVSAHQVALPAPASNSSASYLDRVQLLERAHLNGAQLAASNQSGWALETLCFGDFFHSVRDCAQGQCALGFEMEVGRSGPREAKDDEQLQINEIVHGADGAGQQQQQQQGQQLEQVDEEQEQVVGVALLRQHAVNVPNNKQLRPARWLETWERPEVRPEDNWRFYPKLDCAIQADNVNLLNLYDSAHYEIHSDWLLVGESLDFGASILIELLVPEVAANASQPAPGLNGTMGLSEALGREHAGGPAPLFRLGVQRKLVDFNFDTLYALNTTIDWHAHYNNSTRLALFNMSLADVSEQIKLARGGRLADEAAGAPAGQMFKLLIELQLRLEPHSSGLAGSAAARAAPAFRLSLAHFALADRCFPNPCNTGSCQQNGTQPNDWQCQCDSIHRGRSCQFGRWCALAHVVPPQQQAGLAPVLLQASAQQQQQQQQQGRQLENSQLVVLKQQNQTPPPTNGPRSAKGLGEGGARLTGREFCQRKLGAGSKCTEIDLPLDEQLYLDEGRTFVCACQDDFYLSDEARCKQAHQCHSIVCPGPGQVCDESRPFNSTQPCQCNERQDWYPDPAEPGRCQRRQCHDRKRDCGFEAHVCLPTVPGEQPICKCAPKFAVRTEPGERGRGELKVCRSTACILPTLNDCQHICLADDSNIERPYTCACHEGFALDPTDGRSCRPIRPSQPPRCRPACDSRTQICTERGCRCKQGFVADGETLGQAPGGGSGGANASVSGDYIRSVRCLNICSLSYAENKAEFEKIESVCPLGLCEPNTFNCRCSDPQSAALVNTKYEPIWANDTQPDEPAAEGAGQAGEGEEAPASERRRASPLCHLRRVCRPESAGFRLCAARGAICVPDYTKPAMFDCACPPGTEKRVRGSAGDFSCEPRCSSIRLECLKKQAVCRAVERDQVRCDCLPGMQLDPHDQKCYLARHAYALNLVVVNKYYEPEWRLPSNLENASHHQHDHEQGQGQGQGQGEPEGPLIQEIMPEFQRAPMANASFGRARSLFVAEHNQCNLSQLLPPAILRDPYEQDPATFLQFISQCNERLQQTARTYSLNSRLAEDLRMALRQHLRDFTVTTNNSLCEELPAVGPADQRLRSPTTHKAEVSYLNCTVFLQSQEPVEERTINRALTSCDKHGADERFCWVKPRLLLLKSAMQLAGSSAEPNSTLQAPNPFRFRRLVACELEGFCGDDAYSLRLDESSSRCSCKCPADIEMVDLKELEPRAPRLAGVSALTGAPSEQPLGAIKEICAPRNHCGANSTYCQFKTGSVCQYDIRTGARCNCVYPAYEDERGQCVEVAFSRLDSTLLVVIIMVATCLVVSLAINLYALARSRRALFGTSKQYPLSEFSAAASAARPADRRDSGTSRNGATHNHGRPLNRSTGLPNLAFDPND